MNPARHIPDLSLSSSTAHDLGNITCHTATFPLLYSPNEYNNTFYNKINIYAPRRNCLIAIKIYGYQEQKLKNKHLKFPNN